MGAIGKHGFVHGRDAFDDLAVAGDDLTGTADHDVAAKAPHGTIARQRRDQAMDDALDRLDIAALPPGAGAALLSEDGRDL